MTNTPTTMDDMSWFGVGLLEADCSHWLPYMTADELGLTEPKWMIDLATGEISISYPSNTSTNTTNEEVAA
jgi:hypothetical protein